MDSNPRRRKVRKGTHSCWECKRRKMKCLVDPRHGGQVCNGCRKRGSSCISQEFPDRTSDLLESTGSPVSPEGRLYMEDRNGWDARTLAVPTAVVDVSGPSLPLPPSLLSSSSVSTRSRTTCRFPIESVLFQQASAGTTAVIARSNTKSHKSRLAQLARLLHGALPSAAETAAICRAGSRSKSVLVHELLTVPYAQLKRDGVRPAESLVSQRPGPEEHPVLIARHMLQLAILIQHLNPDGSSLGSLAGLSDLSDLSDFPDLPNLTDLPDLGEHLADVASRLVTTNDDLLGSLEGVECVMLESLYQISLGNLRRAWVAVRRAMTIAQLLGLHRTIGGREPSAAAVDAAAAVAAVAASASYTVLDDDGDLPAAAATRRRRSPAQMWFRIVDLDCYLCLLLGLPQGGSTGGGGGAAGQADLASPASLASEPPLGRLERMHCATASRVLERDEVARRPATTSLPSVSSSSPSPFPSSSYSSAHLATTLALDMEMSRAARCMPGRWWLTPNLLRSYAAGDPQAIFWDMRRLFVQVFHYNLLNQIHLPYMLYRAPPPSSSSTPSTCSTSSTFSLMTCVSASREVLVRFLALRSVVRIASTCHTVDFMALMASLTLLLAHLHSHAFCPELESASWASWAPSTSSSSSSTSCASTPTAVPAPTETSLSHQYLSDRAMVEQVQESLDEVDCAGVDPLSAKSVALLRRLLTIDLMACTEGDNGSVKAQQRHFVTLDQTGTETVDKSDESESSSSSNSSSSSSNPAFSVVHIPYFGTIRIDREIMNREVVADPSTRTCSHSNTHNMAGSSDETATQTAKALSIPIAHTQAGSELVTLPTDSCLDPFWTQTTGCPGLTAGTDNWTFQGDDMAFFDSLTRNAVGEQPGDVAEKV